MNGLVVVTGAAQGIGRAICERLRDEGHGVVAVDIDATGLADAAESLGPACMPLVGDIAPWSTHEAAAAAQRAAASPDG